MKFANFKMPTKENGYEPNIHLAPFSPTYINSYYNSFTYIKKEFTELLQLKKMFEEFIQNFNSLSNLDFFEKLTTFYLVDINNLKQNISCCLFKNPKKYSIKTNDICEILKDEGHGRDFSWWTEYYQAEYDVYSENKSLDPNKVYTKQEIKDLADAKKIIIINKHSYGNEIKPTKTRIEQLKKIEIFSFLPYNFKLYFEHNHMNSTAKTNIFEEYKQIFDLIRNNISKEEVIEDYKKFIDVYNKHMLNMKKIVQEEKQKISSAVLKLNNEKQDLDEFEKKL